MNKQCLISATWIFIIWTVIQPQWIGAQVDNVIWSSVRLRKQVDDKLRLDIRPIMRFNNDISTYQNVSIDISVNRKLNKGWHVQVLSRTWFLPDSPMGQFLWADVGHRTKIGQHALSNRVRLHYSFNTNEINPADFIRLQTTITPAVKAKFRPFLSIEPWFQLDGINGYTRIRYEPGFNYPLGNDYNFTLMYRRQDSLKVEPANKQNHFVITVTKLLR